MLAFIYPKKIVNLITSLIFLNGCECQNMFVNHNTKVSQAHAERCTYLRLYKAKCYHYLTKPIYYINLSLSLKILKPGKKEKELHAAVCD